nr:unnamed protein product [Spirometra erinaceieuropaei]
MHKLITCCLFVAAVCAAPAQPVKSEKKTAELITSEKKDKGWALVKGHVQSSFQNKHTFEGFHDCVDGPAFSKFLSDDIGGLVEYILSRIFGKNSKTYKYIKKFLPFIRTKSDAIA